MNVLDAFALFAVSGNDFLPHCGKTFEELREEACSTVIGRFTTVIFISMEIRNERALPEDLAIRMQSQCGAHEALNLAR
jgi:hypothetical protein